MTLHILMIYPDQHPASTVAPLDDIRVTRLSLAAYNSAKAKRLLRGQGFDLVKLAADVTLDDLRSNTEAWIALKNTTLTANAPLITATGVYLHPYDGSLPNPPILEADPAECEPSKDVLERLVRLIVATSPPGETVEETVPRIKLRFHDLHGMIDSGEALPWARPAVTENREPIRFFHNNPQATTFEERTALIDRIQSGLQITFVEDDTAPVLDALGHWTVPDSSSVPAVPALEAWTERYKVVHDRLNVEQGDLVDTVLRFASESGNKAVFVAGALLPLFLLQLDNGFFDPETRTDHINAGLIGTALGVPYYTDVQWAPGERFIDGIELRIDYDDAQ